MSASRSAFWQAWAILLAGLFLTCLAAFHTKSVVDTGRQWTLRFSQVGSPADTMGYSNVWLVVFGGTSTSLLLSGFLFSLLNTRFKALEMARQLATDLRRLRNEERLILDTIKVGITLVKNRKVQWSNPAHDVIFGCERGEHVGVDTASLYASLEDYKRVGKERLALALKATQEAVWDWDLLANRMYYATSWWNMLGYDKDELVDDPDLWRRLTHPEDLE